jgi:phosphonate transport system substrate-binding protein
MSLNNLPGWPLTIFISASHGKTNKEKKPMINRPLLKVLYLTIILSFSTHALADSNPNQANDELVFGMLPFLSPVALIKRFTPLKTYMEIVTGKTIYLESAPNFPQFVKRTLKHNYDLILTAPHLVPLTLKDGHYKLLSASNKLAGHIMVKSDSKITSLDQLAGKRIAHGPKQAFVVVIGKYLLKSKGLAGDKAPVFIAHKSHNAALRAVLSGEADAAILGTFLTKPASELGLTQLDATPFYPGVAILASKDVPESLQKKISQAFINIKKTKKGKQTLKKIAFPGFQKTAAAEYESLKPVAEDAFDTNTFELK